MPVRKASIALLVIILISFHLALMSINKFVDVAEQKIRKIESNYLAMENNPAKSPHNAIDMKALKLHNLEISVNSDIDPLERSAASLSGRSQYFVASEASKGDIIVNGTVLMYNETYLISGRIIVRSNSTLIIFNSTVIFVSYRNGLCGIEVFPGGTLVVVKSKITSLAITKYYIKIHKNAKLRVIDSVIENVGYSWGANGSTGGLWISSSRVMIINSIFRDCWSGIILYNAEGVFIINVRIYSCLFGIIAHNSSAKIRHVFIKNTFYGIYIRNSSRLWINRLVAINTYYGVLIDESYSVKFCHPEIINASFGILIQNSQYVKLCGSYIAHSLYGIVLHGSEYISICGAHLANTLIGILLWRSAGIIRICGSYIESAYWGIYSVGSSSILISCGWFASNNYAISLQGASNVSIIDSVFVNDSESIDIGFSRNLFLAGILINGSGGISIYDSYNIFMSFIVHIDSEPLRIIRSNNVSIFFSLFAKIDNDTGDFDIGIWIYRSGNITLFGNFLFDYIIVIEDDSLARLLSIDIDLTYVNYYPVLYLKNKNNGTISSKFSQLFLVNSTNVIVSPNTSVVSISIFYSREISIDNINLLGNAKLLISHSKKISVMNISFEGHSQGITVEHSSSIIIGNVSFDFVGIEILLNNSHNVDIFAVQGAELNIQCIECTNVTITSISANELSISIIDSAFCDIIGASVNNITVSIESSRNIDILNIIANESLTGMILHSSNISIANIVATYVNISVIDSENVTIENVRTDRSDLDVHSSNHISIEHAYGTLSLTIEDSSKIQISHSEFRIDNIEVLNVDDIEIRDTTIIQDRDSIYMYDSRNIIITKNIFIGDTTIGLVFKDIENLVIIENIFLNYDIAIYLSNCEHLNLADNNYQARGSPIYPAMGTTRIAKNENLEHSKPVATANSTINAYSTINQITVSKSSTTSPQNSMDVSKITTIYLDERNDLPIISMHSQEPKIFLQNSNTKHLTKPLIMAKINNVRIDNPKIIYIHTREIEILSNTKPLPETPYQQNRHKKPPSISTSHFS